MCEQASSTAAGCAAQDYISPSHKEEAAGSPEHGAREQSSPQQRTPSRRITVRSSTPSPVTAAEAPLAAAGSVFSARKLVGSVTQALVAEVAKAQGPDKEEAAEKAAAGKGQRRKSGEKGAAQRRTDAEPKVPEEDDNSRIDFKDLDDPDKVQALFTPKVIDRTHCMARVWCNGRGGQCSRIAKDGLDFCAIHCKQVPYGRVDGHIPADKVREFLRARTKWLVELRSAHEAVDQLEVAEAASAGSLPSGEAFCEPASEPTSKVPGEADAPQAPKQPKGPGKKASAKASADVPDQLVSFETSSSGDAAVTPATRKRERTPGSEGSAAVKKPRLQVPARKKPNTKKDDEGGLAAKIPYGANFVKQDLKRNGRKGAATGKRSAAAAASSASRYHTRDGRLKSKYSKSADDDNGRWKSAKEMRFEHYRQQALSSKTLLGSSGQSKVPSFSPSLTPELLEALLKENVTGLGEIACTRPPDVAPVAVPLQDQPAAAPLQDQPAAVPLASYPQDVVMGAPVETSASAGTAAMDAEGLEQHVHSLPSEQPMQEGQRSEQAESDRSTSATGLLEDGQLVVQDPLPQAPSASLQDLSQQSLEALLQGTFGHREFRPGQCEAISSVLQGTNTLLLLSTGSGKSLCYQMPAYLLREEGLTLVVSPLVSLMADQLMRLPNCLRGAIVSSQQKGDEVKSVLRAVRARLVDVLFVSPERLSLWAFDGCGLPPIALACVDEAHCVSEWSHNFRPDYLRLHEFLVGSLGARRLLALTATATRPTVQSVCNILHIGQIVRSDRCFSLSEMMEEPAQPTVQRANLTMDVRCVSDEMLQERELIKILREEDHVRESVIVYVWKRATADQLAKRLRTLIRGGVRSYHGSMVPEARRSVQDAFMSGMTRVVVATMAFGMGLDKPDIRTVIHFGMPKSIENYIQETGRCSRDGQPGRCIALVAPQNYKAMRWMETGGGGASKQSSIVRKLLGMVLRDGEPGPQKRFELSDGAVRYAAEAAQYAESPEAAGKVEMHQPFYVSFEESDATKALNCPADELHSALAHFAFRAKEHVTLYSKFPTKLKLRFFGRSDVSELSERITLLGKVLPLAKKCSGVYTIETAKALSVLGGQPGQLSNALWQAQGNEFSVEKAEYGYMVLVMKQVGEQQIQAWSEEISSINSRARENGIEKLDAAFIALTRAAEVADAAQGQDTSLQQDSGASELTVHQALSGLIDSYFAATRDPSSVVAGDWQEKQRRLQKALGQDFRGQRTTTVPDSAPKIHGSGPAQSSSGGNATEAVGGEERHAAQRAAIYTLTARLVMSSDWPDMPSDDPRAVAHTAAQFLAGIGSMMMPATKWRDHRCWGACRKYADFDELEELVASSLQKLNALRAAKLVSAGQPNKSV